MCARNEGKIIDLSDMAKKEMMRKTNADKNKVFSVVDPFWACSRYSNLKFVKVEFFKSRLLFLLSKNHYKMAIYL